MSGSLIVNGDNITITANEKTYCIKKSKPDDVVSEWKKVEQHLKRSRKSPLEAIAPALRLADAATREMLVKLAYEDMKKSEDELSVSNSDITKFVESIEGLKFSLGLTIRKSYPEVTDTEIDEIFSAIGEQAARNLQEKINEEAIKSL